jgi:hypothetical protein
MPSIRSAQITAFYLFDIAEAVSLGELPGLIGVETSAARIAAKPSIPAYVQYQQPPLIVDGEAVGIGAPDHFKIRFKVFDYGIISLALMRPFSGDWVGLIALGQGIMENEGLEQQAESACRNLVARIAPALVRRRESFLTEDYLVFAVTGLERPLTGRALVQTHKEEIALLLRGERHALSRQEEKEILRHRISYFANDLVVPTWNAALVYDTEASVEVALEILEFANSQLLQFRYYDDLLDAELARTYSQVQTPRWYEFLGGRRYTRAAHHLHAVFIEVNELTDRTENALKIVGDIYAARLLTLVAARLGLDRWKASVEHKLQTLDDIYGFAVEQTAMWRGQFLELTIVLILILELALFFLGIMR